MPSFFLTRQAFHDLARIENYTVDTHGQRQADTYIRELYESFSKIARNPQIGVLRQYRSAPFLMAPVSEHHYAIYHEVGGKVVIVTVLHSRQNIETILQRIGPALEKEISEILKDTQ